MFRTAATPQALMQECFHLKIEAEPGTRAEYSDPGFILLGKALETVTGERLDAWMRSGDFSAAGDAGNGILSTAGHAGVDSANGRGHNISLSPNPGRGSG